jgi:hypothetical protein
MSILPSILFPYEQTALIEALRRDERRELERAEHEPKWKHWHMENARLSRRLLDLIQLYSKEH